MTSAAEFQAKVDQFQTDVPLLHQIVHGPVGATVTTDNGPVPTIASVLNEITGAANGLEVQCTAVVYAPGQWKLTPKEGYAVTNGGIDNKFAFDAPEDSGESVSISIAGFIPDVDPRILTTHGETSYVGSGAIKEDGRVVIAYKASGNLELLLPAILPDGLAPTQIPCTIVDHGTYWTWTPLDPTTVNPNGVGQTLVGIAPANSTGSSNFRVIGINDTDERNCTLSDGTSQVPLDAITEGGFVEVKYHGEGTPREGFFELVSPAATSSSGSTAFIVPMVTVSRVANYATIQPAPGAVLPNNSGDGYAMAWQVDADGVPEAGWIVAVLGISSEPFQLRYRDESDVEPTRPKEGDIAFIGRPGGTGQYKLLELWTLASSKGEGSSGSGMSDRDRVLALWTNQNAADARKIASRKQDAYSNLDYFGALTGAADKVAYFTGAGSMAVVDFKASGRAILAAADYAAIRTLLSLVPGTNVQAYDATLQAWAGVTVAANTGFYGTGTDAFATYTLTAGGRALGGITGTSGAIPYFSAAQTVSEIASTSAGRSMLSAADAAAQRTLLALGTLATQNANAVAITGGTVFGLNGLQVTGSTPPTSGSGLEIQGGANVVFQAYNRTGGAYIGFTIDATQIAMRPAGTTKLLANTTQVQISGSLRLPSYTIATMPSAATHTAGSMIYVTDESGGATPAFSDGTNWRRVADRAIVS